MTRNYARSCERQILIDGDKVQLVFTVVGLEVVTQDF